ncbi:MAG: hypothetical protein R3D85_09615 [Paracoccaceae bacterium]
MTTVQSFHLRRRFQAAAAQNAAAAVNSPGNRLISSDFQTFLEMLTAQMQN